MYDFFKYVINRFGEISGYKMLQKVRKCNAMDSWGVIFFLVNYDFPVNGRNISGESLFPKGSHYLLVNNDRGSHYLLVKNDRGVIFSGESFFTATPGATFCRRR